MMCFECKNCKADDLTYFCPMKNQFCAKEMEISQIERNKIKWKKGNPNYESRRRKLKKEPELQIKD